MAQPFSHRSVAGSDIFKHRALWAVRLRVVMLGKLNEEEKAGWPLSYCRKRKLGTDYASNLKNDC